MKKKDGRKQQLEADSYISSLILDCNLLFGFKSYLRGALSPMYAVELRNRLINKEKREIIKKKYTHTLNISF